MTSHISARDKGKRRAMEDTNSATEASPLLGPSVQHPPLIVLDANPSQHWNWSWRRAMRTFCICLGLTLVAFVLLVLAAASRLRQDVKLDEAVKWKLDNIELLNVTESGPERAISLWMELHMLVSFDFGDLDPWEQTLLSWGMATLDVVSVSSSAASVFPKTSGTEEELATISLSPFEFVLPRSTNQHADLIVPLLVTPSTNLSYCLNVAETGWESGQFDVITSINNLIIRGTFGWKRLVRFNQDVVLIPMSFDVPKIPFLPPPPTPLLPALMSVLTLSDIAVNVDRKIKAKATIPNPLPYLNVMPFYFNIVPSLTGLAALPPINDTENSTTTDPLPIAKASAGLISLSSTSVNISVPLQGELLPIPSTQEAGQQLSNFLSTYLAELPSPIIISAIDRSIPFMFPPPHPKPKVLRDVKLSDMRITLRGLEGASVSGRVEVTVALPKGLHLDLNVHRITVDVIAYDGPIPEDDVNATWSLFPFPFPIPIPFPVPLPKIGLPIYNPDEPRLKPVPPPHSLPSPLPMNAFARIRPQEWLNATSQTLILSRDDPDNGEEVGTQIEVKASFDGVPLEILPGRDAAFRSFVRKFLFSSAALTGIKGFAGVGIAIPGLTADEGEDGQRILELLDLPFDGAVLIGKGNF